MITFKCPKCGGSMEVPESVAGQAEACPACGNVATVPSVRRRPRLFVVLATVTIVGSLIVLGVFAAAAFWPADPVELSHTAADRAAAGDKRRADDILRIAILEQYARRPGLARRDIDRVVELIGMLEARLGDLGLSFDRSTGRISGLDPPRDRSQDDLFTGGQPGDAKLRAELASVTAEAKG